MFAAKKIITVKQMRTALARKSSVMKDFIAKGGDVLMKKKSRQNEFWNGLRAESKSHEFGDKGFTKKGLTKYLGKLLINKEDHFSDRRLKKFSDKLGIKRKNLINASVEARLQQKNANIGQKYLESQIHKQKEKEFHSHINEIISRKRENPKSERTSLGVAMNNNEAASGKVYKGDFLAKFEKSDSNIKKADNYFFHAPQKQPVENKSQAFGHILYLKNKHHDYVSEENELKNRLARIQGKSDNGINDEETNEEIKLAA